MAVVLHIKCVVTLTLRRVHRFIHRLEHGKVDGIFQRRSADRIEHFLNFESAFDGIRIDPKVLHEAAKLTELATIRRRVNPMKEIQFEVIKPSCNGLIASQHELLNDLMAFGMFHPIGPTHFPCLIEF